MGTPEQFQEMLDLLKQQVATMQNLQNENVRLREEVAQPTAGAAESSTYRSKKPDRPTVNVDIDEREWALFIDAWGMYKKMCHLAPTQVESIRLELRAACSSDVNRMLFEYVGATTLDASTEDQMLVHIKSVAVKTVHKEVHRMTFSRMVQDQGESVTSYVARLKAQAFLCRYEIPCTCCTPPKMISYAEEEVSQQLLAGLRNQEHLQKVMAEAESLTTLDLKVKRLQVLETTEESASSLHNVTPPIAGTEAALAKSQYKAGKVASKLPSEEILCQWCGLGSHPNGKSLERKNCPANKKNCSKCQKKGHFARVCKSAAAAAATGEDETGEQLEPLATDASVSFAFGAESGQQDFRLGWQPNGRK